MQNYIYIKNAERCLLNSDTVYLLLNLCLGGQRARHHPSVRMGASRTPWCKTHHPQRFEHVCYSLWFPSTVRSHRDAPSDSIKKKRHIFRIKKNELNEGYLKRAVVNGQKQRQIQLMLIFNLLASKIKCWLTYSLWFPSLPVKVNETASQACGCTTLIPKSCFAHFNSSQFQSFALQQHTHTEDSKFVLLNDCCLHTV